jgi:hypothetical protein
MAHKETLTETFNHWFPFAIITVLLAGFAYIGIQQNYRMAANDPQIQITEDISAALDQGKVGPDEVFPPSTTEADSSLTPFAVVYSATGTPISSTAVLDGKMPTMPAGVFDYAKQHGQNRFTWQPKSGVRMAAVLVKYGSGDKMGYVMAARSLREVEARVKQLTIMAAVASAATLLLTFLAIWFMTHRKTKHHHAIPEEAVSIKE